MGLKHIVSKERADCPNTGQILKLTHKEQKLYTPLEWLIKFCYEKNTKPCYTIIWTLQFFFGFPLDKGAGGLIFLEMSTYFVGVREGGQEFMGLIFLEMST